MLMSAVIQSGHGAKHRRGIDWWHHRQQRQDPLWRTIDALIAADTQWDRGYRIPPVAARLQGSNVIDLQPQG